MARETIHQHLTNEYLLNIQPFSLRSKIILEGTISGQHASPYHGYSSEFSQYRSYSPGDDLKTLDWKILGRTEKLVCRQYRDETNTGVYGIIDSSLSMNFPEGLSKLKYATIMAGSLCYQCGLSRDAFGLITGSSRPEVTVNPRNSNSHLNHIYSTLDSLEASGKTDLHALSAATIPHLKSGSIVYIFTDLWDDTEAVIQGLCQFNARSMDIRLVHMWSQEEEEFFRGRSLELRDMETGQLLRINSGRTAEAYREKTSRHLDSIKDYCYRSGISFIQTKVETSFFDGYREISQASINRQDRS